MNIGKKIKEWITSMSKFEWYGITENWDLLLEEDYRKLSPKEIWEKEEKIIKELREKIKDLEF